MKTITLNALLALLTGAIATAQPQRDPQGPPPGPPSPLVGLLDADHDKVISAGEIAAASTALATLDQNGDGQLTRDELRPQRPEGGPPDGDRPEGGPPDGGRRAKGDRSEGGPPDGAGMPDDAPGPPQGAGHRRPAPPLIAALDTDHDGTLSAAEIAAAPASLTKLDKNGDDQLTPDEFAPRPPQRSGKAPRPGTR